MFIDNTQGVVNSSNIVSDEEIIAKIFEICPQIVFYSILKYDFSNYINTIPQHCNNTILRALKSDFQHIIDHYFIEVVEDASFDYEYGDICSTHHELASVGYVPRNSEFEELAMEIWDYNPYY